MKEIAVIVVAICVAAVAVAEIRKDGGGCFTIAALLMLWMCLAGLLETL